MLVKGSVTIQRTGLTLAASNHLYDHSDYFGQYCGVDPDHYLVSHDTFSILLNRHP